MSDLNPERDPHVEGPDLEGLLGGLTGDGGLGNLLAGAQQAMAASEAVSSQEVEGTSGGGMVRIRATAGGEVRSVSIDPAVVDPADVEGLEDLVVAAMRDLNARVTELHQEAMSGAMGGLDPSAMLGGLFGGGAPDAADPEDADSEEE